MMIRLRTERRGGEAITPAYQECLLAITSLHPHNNPCPHFTKGKLETRNSNNLSSSYSYKV
jgi:hypothetical protein